MTKPARIAKIPCANGCPTPATILAALIDDPSLCVLAADRLHRPTPLARRVGRMLCSAYGLEAWRSHMAAI